jgi:hypothetical protein
MHHPWASQSNLQGGWGKQQILFIFPHTRLVYLFGKGKEQCDGYEAPNNILCKCLRHFIRVNGTLA